MTIVSSFHTGPSVKIMQTQMQFAFNLIKLRYEWYAQSKKGSNWNPGTKGTERN